MSEDINELRAKLKASEGKPGLKARAQAIRDRIAELEARR
jgi:flagellar biosynthesis protein FlhB